MTRLPFGRTVPGNRWDLARDDPAARRTVSVVVTHFEQPEQLRRTLAALRRQTRPADQVVVSDDGSATPPEAGPDVVMVAQHDSGFRAAAARNLGAARATGDLLVFLDADTTPEPGFLEQITRLPARLPELLAVGRRRHADLAAAPSELPVEQAGPQHELTEPAWLRRGYVETDDLRQADATSHRYVISSVLACSRWWFAELGGFDERFVGYGGEDWELAARSWRRGGLLAHVPGAVAWHDGPAAGESGRTSGSADHATFDQALALAGRVGAPGATYHGLLLGPVDLVVTVEPGLDRQALTVTLDSLLAALPRCRVTLAPPAASWFAADPRVEPTVSQPPPSTSGPAPPTPRLDDDHRLHLHLTSAVVGPTDAWTDLAALADGVDPPATTTLVTSDGRGIGVLHDLRQHRRAHRQGATVPDLLTTGVNQVALRPADHVSLQAWLEGWA